MRASTSDITRVVVLTPEVDGMGGISRLVDAVAGELGRAGDASIEVEVVSTRGARRWRRPLIFARALARVGWLCATRRCNVVHINLASFGSTYRKLCFAAVARLTGTAYVVHLHGGMYQQFWASRPSWLQSVIGSLFANAAQVLVLGSVWADLIRQRVPEVNSRIVVLPNAAARPAIRAEEPRREDTPTILFLGKICDAKGLPTLLEALAGLPREAEWRAVLAGDGDVDAVRARASQLGLSDRICVPGWVDKEGTEKLWLDADIFVLPSLVENLPLSILEAFSYGVPVVCTPVGAVPEIVEHGRNGLLVPVRDAVGLRDALQQLLTDPALRTRIARNGHGDYIARFELSGYVRRLVGIWKSSHAVKSSSAARAPRTV